MKYIEEFYIFNDGLYHKCIKWRCWDEVLITHNIYVLRKDKVYKCFMCSRCVPNYLSSCFTTLLWTEGPYDDNKPIYYTLGKKGIIWSEGQLKKIEYETIYIK